MAFTVTPYVAFAMMSAVAVFTLVVWKASGARLAGRVEKVSLSQLWYMRNARSGVGAMKLALPGPMTCDEEWHRLVKRQT